MKKMEKEKGVVKGEDKVKGIRKEKERDRGDEKGEANLGVNFEKNGKE